MKLIGSFLFCAILIGISFKKIGAYRFRPSYFGQKPICPKYNNFSVDLSDPSIELQNLQFWVDKIWNTTCPPLSKKARALRAATKDMARSDNPLWRNVAASLTWWLWTILPQIDFGTRPSMCGYAKVINATVAAGGNPLDCGLLRDITNGLVTAGSDSASFVSRTARMNAGCFPGKMHTPAALSCYKNGAVYESDGLWAIKGGSYPTSFQNAVKALTKSYDYNDKFMAALATASITDSMIIFYNNLDKKYIYQAFTLQTVSWIDRRCCESLNRDIEETFALTFQTYDFARNATLAANGC